MESHDHRHGDADFAHFDAGSGAVAHPARSAREAMGERIRTTYDFVGDEAVPLGRAAIWRRRDGRGMSKVALRWRWRGLPAARQLQP